MIDKIKNALIFASSIHTNNNNIMSKKLFIDYVNQRLQDLNNDDFGHSTKVRELLQRFEKYSDNDKSFDAAVELGRVAYYAGAANRQKELGINIGMFESGPHVKDIKEHAKKAEQEERQQLILKFEFNGL